MGSAVKQFVGAVVVALLLAQPAAAVTLVAHVSGSGTSASSNVNTTGATFFVMACSSIGGFSSVSDSASNTWTSGNQVSDGHSRSFRLSWVVNPTTSATHNFSCPDNSNNAFAVAAFDDTPASAFDTQNVGFSTASFGSATSVQPGTLTPGIADNLFIVGVGGDGYDAISIDGGFTIADHINKVAFSHEMAGIAYLVQSSATAQNPTWSFGSGDFSLQAISATFKTNGGGSPPPSCTPTLSLLGVGRCGDEDGDGISARNPH